VSSLIHIFKSSHLAKTFEGVVSYTPWPTNARREKNLSVNKAYLWSSAVSLKSCPVTFRSARVLTQRPSLPDKEKMKIGYLFPAVVGITGVALLVWFIASGAWMPGA